MKNKAVIEFALFASILALLIYRATYGYSFNDEPFIITVAQRLYMGDSLIFDEWHLSQSFSPLVLLPYTVYFKALGTTEGILLAFRIIYCFTWTITCFYVFHLLLTSLPSIKCLEKKKSIIIIIAITVVLFLALFSPHDNMTISYNSLGLESLIWLSGILLRAWSKEPKHLHCFCFVIAFLVSVNVMCCPLMSIFYLLLWVILLICSICKKGRVGERIVIEIAILICALFMLYIWFFVCRNNDLSLFLPSIKAILNDPEHPTSSVLSSMMKLVETLGKKCHIYTLVLVLSMLLTVFRMQFAKRYRVWIFLACGTGFILAVFNYLIRQFTWGLNYQVIDIALLGLECYLLLDDKPKRLFYCFYIIGFAYSIANYLSSNTGLMALGMGFTLCGVGGIVFCYMLALEIMQIEPKKKSIAIAIICTIVTIQLGSEAYTKAQRAFWDAPPAKLNEVISCGAPKGLKTTKTHKAEYERMYYNLMTLLHIGNVNCNDDFVSFTSAPVVYLDSMMPNGSFSAWTFGYEDTLVERLAEYYEHNKEKKASIIFCNNVSDLPPEFDVGRYRQLFYNGSLLLVHQDE